MYGNERTFELYDLGRHLIQKTFSVFKKNIFLSYKSS